MASASDETDATGDETPARTVLSWSGGKDAALALAEFRDRDDVAVVALLTTVSAATDRSTMHGVRRDLYERQADAVGLPLELVALPENPSNEEYEAAMADVMAAYEKRGVEQVAFADLFLEDVRAYREERLADTGIEGCWPVWGRDTDEFAREFLDRGFEATVVAVDGDALDASFAGRPFDADFLADLPDDVDPCGEHGAFHTFVHDGPIFAESVPVEVGETVTKPVGDGEYHYCDLLVGAADGGS